MTSGITYVVVAAVENYNEPKDFPKVDFAKKDAEDFISALKKLGYDDEDIVPLINEKATRAAIIQKIKKITERAIENDRIIFYFAGHGFYENGENLLGSVDAIKTAKPETCVPLNLILGLFKKSLSKHKILFLDACHSGFEAGEYIRTGLDNFESDELIYQFSKEEYFIGFASCKTNQTSVSHVKLQNGVWTHFLLKAISGEVPEIYTKGLLFSDKLQAYLNKQTTEFVKLNTVSKLDQTPIKFGSETDKFIIADLNPIFEERERSRKTSDLSFTRISLINEESDFVKNLPGFQKGFHKVPIYIGSSPNRFIQEIGSEIIEEEISEISKEIKENLNYKRTELKVSVYDGGGSITTPHFDFNIAITQSEDDAAEFIITRSLENFKDNDIVLKPEFNKIFSRHFNRLNFELNRAIDVEEFIDNIENMENDSPISVEYDLTDLSNCIVTIDGLDYKIYVDTDSISIRTDYDTNPEKLIIAFRETHKALLSNPELNLLE